MNLLLVWIPWMAIAAIPGIFNILAAFEELNDRCRLLPFFEPLKTPGVWVWGVVQFGFPATLFWGSASLGSQPSISPELISDAALFGLGFVAVLNAQIQIGANTIPIKSAYTYFINIAYRMIAHSQDDRVYRFWLDVQNALETVPDLSQGLDYLQEYYEIEVEITQQPMGDVIQELEQIRDLSDRNDQARRIKTLLKGVSRKRLHGILKQFAVDDGLLKRYFTASVRSRKRRRRRWRSLLQRF
ncbi:MAG: hypothetical protein WBA57_11660 [Elainellaceae cyanobacterium]